MQQIEITTPYITLQQSLKLADILSSGGSVKFFLQEVTVHVNNELENRRGRKLYPGDVVNVEGMGSFKVIAKAD